MKNMKPIKIGKYYILFHKGIKFVSTTKQGVLEKANKHQ